MPYSKSYARPADAYSDFLAFATQARTKIDAHPDWKEWLLSTEITDPDVLRGPGKWRQDWQGLSGGAMNSFDASLGALRLLKQREYLRIGLLDFSGFATVDETMRQVSDLADFCLQAVLEIAEAPLAEKWGRPETPFAILGMGKLGGQELNYSSDIDVIFIFGEEGQIGRLTYNEYFTRLAQTIINAFSSQSGEGSLFRIDLRLRPEGDSGSLVSSLEACENYYSAYGETWERMALLKARTSAGDKSLGYEFEQMRTAFCYPRSLSLEVIEEIAAIKQRIERKVVGMENLDLHVKLGTGGIREIEFIVQALQVLNGARLPYFQHRSTLKALDLAATLDVLPRDKVMVLQEAYRWWRTVEHRLQMVADLQTHSLPRDPARRAQIAGTLGLEVAEFERLITTHRVAVREIFDEVFSEQKTISVGPVSIATDFFEQPEHAQKDLQALEPDSKTERHVSPRTRRSFQRFCVVLEEFLRECVDPDLSLTRLVRFVDAYGAHSLLYESLANNPKALELLLKIFDRSRFYSELLVSRPELFEEAARSGTLDFRKTTNDYIREMDLLKGEVALEARRYRRGELMRIFLRDILGLDSLPQIQREYSALARACLDCAVKQVKPKSPLLIVGMGKLGGAELSYGSDLDCLMVGEDADAGRALSKFMTDLLPTGILFPLDFRLRPNGEGPICVPLEAYSEYYANKAQVWEIQALSRARVVAGDEELGRKFLAVIEPIWQERVRQPDFALEVAKMRYRIETERVDLAHRDLEFKTGVGGMIDVEFGVQTYLMQRGVREPGTWRGLHLLADQRPELAQTWRDGYLFLRRIESILRSDQNSSVSKLPAEAKELSKLARRLGYADAEAFKMVYDQTRAAIRSGYDSIMPPVPR